jgi:hypothetical protein
MDRFGFQTVMYVYTRLNADTQIRRYADAGADADAHVGKKKLREFPKRIIPLHNTRTCTQHSTASIYLSVCLSVLEM